MAQPCYPCVAVITVVSVLHRKQLLFSRQCARLAFLWMKTPSCTLPHKSWQPKPARKLTVLFEACLTWFFRIFKHGTSSAQSTAPTGFQCHYLPLQRLFERCVLCYPRTEGQGGSSFLEWYRPSYPCASLLQCTLLFCLCSREDGWWGVLKWQSVNEPWRLLWCFKGCSFGLCSVLLPLLQPFPESERTVTHLTLTPHPEKGTQKFQAMSKKVFFILNLYLVSSSSCIFGMKNLLAQTFLNLAKSQARKTGVL